MLNWLEQFSTFCFLDSNGYDGNKELIAGAGVVRACLESSPNALSELQAFIDEKASWLFGHLGYELDTAEKMSHAYKPDMLQFPDLFFFEPEVVIIIKNNILTIHAANAQVVFDAIIQSVPINSNYNDEPLPVENRISKDEYLDIIQKLQNHIQRGDCYEINFCQEFFADNITADPFLLFKKLNQVSPNPFSGFYRLNDKWLLCASPERFLKKEKRKIISQPIKGTLKREPGEQHQQEARAALLNSEKDRAENVMVVDLVRNDLSRICQEGSVQVDELFGIYSFPQVHQMISTISGTLKEDACFADIIHATFPMGSMTGAPKVSVMKLIGQYEKSRRGVFSGALGYIDPEGDFDFNVVIRSLMYNQSARYLSFQTGGGITIYSDAEKEWEECMLKAKAIKEVLKA